MERQYAAVLAEGQRVDEVFALRGKDMRASRTGEAYLSLEFADKSGRAAGIMFRPTRDAASALVGSVVRVRGTVTSYRGSLRISVDSLLPAAHYEPAEILPTSPRDPEEMLRELREHVRAITDPAIAGVVKAVFGEREFMRRFKVCPASVSHHHAYIGGLLEHTVAVAGLCRAIANIYPQADADMLLAGALLHDIGVVDELEFRTIIEPTEGGRLLGHAVLGERRLARVSESERSALAIGQRDRLAHILLAHHAAVEASGPLAPCTLEVMLVARADQIDAVSAIALEGARSLGLVDEEWSGPAASTLAHPAARGSDGSPADVLPTLALRRTA